jgi:hypothetical protein
MRRSRPCVAIQAEEMDDERGGEPFDIEPATGATLGDLPAAE